MDHNEAIVAQFDDLADGEMKEVSVGETDILLSRVNGRYYAVGANCRHYGAPLAKGFLNGSRVVCPWHQACYDVTTGTLEEPPALDDLARYEVRRDGDDVIVVLPEVEEEAAKTGYDRDIDDRLFVIVGGGAAGAAAAITLRRGGYRGRLVMISSDDRLPYDRPNLSKAYLAGEAEEDWMPLRPEKTYPENDIEVMLETRVERVDVQTRTVTFADDREPMEADSILLATGGTPRRLDVSGADLKKVFTLRTFSDCEKIISAAEDAKKVVIIGASFIGTETAASLRERGLEVTVVAPEEVPFENVLGERIGRFLQRKHEEHGVRYRLTSRVKAFEGAEAVERVLLEDGDSVDADFVLVGIGVDPVTDYIAGVEKLKDGSVKVDEYLRVADGVYAAGDIVTFPDPRTGEDIRIEHWRLAEQHGRIAAMNMLGKQIPFKSTPFFWTRHFGSSIQYVGFVRKWDEIIFHGAPEEEKFLAYLAREGEIRAVAALGHGKTTGAIHELLRLGLMPAADEVRSGSPEMFEKQLASV